MTDYIVTINGSNKATGTIKSPFATINHAVGVAKAGDKILVRGGVHSGPVNIWKGGKSGAPLTIKAYPGERPVISGEGTARDTDLVAISASYVQFEGFEVRGATRSGIAIWSATDVVIRDNVVHDAVRCGIWVGAARPGLSARHLIEGNIVYDTVRENIARDWKEGWARGLAIDVSTDTVVRNNTVFKNYGEGIGALSSTRVQYIGNAAYDNYSVQLYIDNSQHITVKGNTFGHTSDERFYRYDKPGVGVLIANEYTDHEMSTCGIIVRDNVFSDVAPAAYDGSFGRGGGITGSTLTPNVETRPR